MAAVIFQVLIALINLILNDLIGQYHMWRDIGTEFSCRAACRALQALQDGG